MESPAAPVPTTTPTPSADRTRQRGGQPAARRRRLILGAAFVVLGGLSAMLQTSETALGDGIFGPSATGRLPEPLRSILSPIVVGRQPEIIDCDLRAVTAISPTNVWVAGALAFVARSEDGGATWQQERVPQFQGPPPRDPTKAPSTKPPTGGSGGGGASGALFGLLERTAYAADEPAGEYEYKKEKKAKKAKKGDKPTDPNAASRSLKPGGSPGAPSGSKPGEAPGEPAPGPDAGGDSGSGAPPDFIAIHVAGLNSEGKILSDDGKFYTREPNRQEVALWQRDQGQPEREPFRAAQFQGSINVYQTFDKFVVQLPPDQLKAPMPEFGFGDARATFLTPHHVLYRVRGDGNVERLDPDRGGSLNGIPPGGEHIQGLFFTDDDHGWAVGGDGLILVTSQAAQSWKVQNSGSHATLRAAFFLDDREHGWAVGDGGTVLGTTDGGERWTALTRLHEPGVAAAAKATTRVVHLPAPWYWLSLLVVGLFVGRSFRERPKDGVKPADGGQAADGHDEQGKVASLFVTDNPVEDPKDDRLALNRVALGLSRFLRNDATAAPLTVAITGDWGTGKSSLMKLLRTDLLQFDFRPVWFNAWHYQKEHHMLAGLLQAIRLQAVPGWLSQDGLRLRWRLLLARGRQFWTFVGFVAFMLSLSIAFEVRSHGGLEALDQAWNAVIEALGKPGGLGDILKLLGSEGSRVGILTSGVALLETLRRGTRAFGVDPAALLAGVSGGARPSELSAKTSVRQKFAAQFQEVTRALGVRKMIIFVDDLDRCRPERVVETLEAVNFVVSSGECFVILGMAPERVIPCIGLSFKAVAAEMPTLWNGAMKKKMTPREKRAAFAREYLDKLINIEIPVPTPTSQQAGDLLLGESSAPLEATGEAPEPASGERDSPKQPKDQTPKKKRTAVERAFAAGVTAADLGKRFAPTVFVAAALLATTVVGGRAGYRLAKAPPSTPTTKLNVQNQDKAAHPEVKDAGKSTGTSAPAFERPDRTGQKAEVSGAPETANLTPGIVSGATLLLVGLLAWFVLTLRPNPVVRDSDKFKRALLIWRDVVYARRPTPRALKRFVNRVRYLAMGQREPERIESLLEHWLQRAIDGEREAPPSAESKGSSRDIADSTLVALAAIHEVGGDAFVPAVDVHGGRDDQFVAAVHANLTAILDGEKSVSKAWGEHEKIFKTNRKALEAAAAVYARQASSVRAN